jgi:hypothetical protein
MEIKQGYISPKVLSHQPIRFETACSWNKGVGEKVPCGNGWVNHPNDPRPQKPGTGPDPHPGNPPVNPGNPGGKNR